MKLDSEEQREDLLELLSTVRVSTTLGTIHETQAEADRIMDPIRNAGIEGEDEQQVVPIESLAPDPPKLEAVP